MENPININREMANALRALAVADHGPMADRVDVVTALAKLGIKCQPLGGALFIGNRDTLALADYIDRPSGNADDAERSRLDIQLYYMLTSGTESGSQPYKRGRFTNGIPLPDSR